MNLIVSVLLKPTIILFFALLLSMLWRQASASTRYAILALSLLSAFALPVAELLLPRFDLPLMSAPQPSIATMLSPTPALSLTGQSTPDFVSDSQSTSNVSLGDPVATAAPHTPIMAILSLAWFIGFAAVLVRLFIGVRAARRLATSSMRPDEDWHELLVALRSQLSVTQSVRVAVCNNALSPITWGFETSIIVLPTQSSQWSIELRRSVLTHELAHVKRRDLLLQVLAQAACAFYWFNPLFWYVSARLRIEREEACDDYVLNFGANPSNYAANLLQIARAGIAERPAPAAMAMAHGSHLETRLRAIIAADRNRQVLPLMSRASLFCGIAVLTAAVAAIQLTTLPAMPLPRSFAVPPATPKNNASGGSVRHESFTSTQRASKPSVSETSQSPGVMSLDREIALGSQLADKVERSFTIVNDAGVGDYVSRIGQTVARNSDAKIPFNFKVTKGADLNAFALPGGFVYVDTGLILSVDDESELAAVLAHLIAHVTARHGLRGQLTGALSDAAPPLVSLDGLPSLDLVRGEGMVPQRYLAFSGADEMEADYLGIQYAYHAGYDPSAFVRVLQRLWEKESFPGTVSPMFVTHPPMANRVAATMNVINTLLPVRNYYTPDPAELDAVKKRTRDLN